MGSARYANGFTVTLHEDLLDVPIRWRASRVIFVNSMSDLFHEPHQGVYSFVVLLATPVGEVVADPATEVTSAGRQIQLPHAPATGAAVVDQRAAEPVPLAPKTARRSCDLDGIVQRRLLPSAAIMVVPEPRNGSRFRCSSPLLYSTMSRWEDRDAGDVRGLIPRREGEEFLTHERMPAQI